VISQAAGVRGDADMLAAVRGRPQAGPDKIPRLLQSIWQSAGTECFGVLITAWWLQQSPRGI